MENHSGPGHQGDPIAPDGPPSGDPTDARGADSGQRAQQSTLSAGLAAFQGQLRDAQRELVDRIADVDDDRRRSVAQFQRALETQRDEIDEGLRRQGRVILVGLTLLAVLTAAAIYGLYRQMSTELGAMRQDVATLKSSAGERSGVARPDAEVERKLAEMATALERVSASVEQLTAERVAPVASTEPAPLDDEVEALRAQQQQLSTELTRLRESLRAAQSAASPAPADSGTATATDAPAPVAPPESEGTPRPSEPSAESSGVETNDPADSAGTQAASGAAEQRISVGDRRVALQLIGFYSLDELKTFANKAELPSPVYFREETYRGRPWFVLIHSLHDSAEEAAAARAALPPSLAGLDIWIRTLDQGSDLSVLTADPSR